MKTKYLFGMLLSGAMLAACTADDIDSAPVAQDVNPSAPVFTVSLYGEGEQNRANYVTDGEKISFDNTDVISLYHGVLVDRFEGDGFVGYQNAIYKTNTAAEEGKMDFVTSSMIYPGYAVMVYPADTTFVWRTIAENGTPVVSVPAVQNDETIKQTPYISEILEIKDWTDGKTSDQAGYGRNYDITLKRAASLLSLKLDYSTEGLNLEGLGDIHIDSVEFDTNSDNEKFTTSIAIKVDGETKVTSAEEYPIWAKSSALDVTKITGDSKTISSKCIDDDNVARFTFLPIKAEIDVKNETENDRKYWFTTGKFIVHTNYGDVTIDNTERVWGAETDKDEDLQDGKTFISRIMKSFSNPEVKTGVFANEYQGGKISGQKVKIDLTKVSLKGKHVKTQKDLSNIIKVYKAFNTDLPEGAKPEDVTVVLDGTDGTFVIDDLDILNELEEMMASETYNLKFAACNVNGEVCNTVEIQNKTASAVDVPELIFQKVSEVEGKSTNNVLDVALVGKWNWKELEEATRMSSVHLLKLTGEETVLSLNNVTVDADNGISNSQYAFTIEVGEGATINVSGNVELHENMENYGTINIPQNVKLIVADGKTLNNNAARGKAANGFNEGCGTIDQRGNLAVKTEQNKNNEINNYGLINIYNNAITLINKNADTNPSITTVFGERNRFGTIYLREANAGNGNLTIKEESSAKGFIKYDAGATTYQCTKKNYIVIGSNVNTFTKDTYVEVLDRESTLTAEGTGISALILHENATLYVATDKTLSGTYILQDGDIWLAGTLTFTNQTGYFNSEAGKGDIISYE